MGRKGQIREVLVSWDLLWEGREKELESPPSGQLTWRDGGAIPDLGLSEEKEQGQEEWSKFRCGMLGKRHLRDI